MHPYTVISAVYAIFPLVQHCSGLQLHRYSSSSVHLLHLYPKYCLQRSRVGSWVTCLSKSSTDTALPDQSWPMRWCPCALRARWYLPAKPACHPRSAETLCDRHNFALYDVVPYCAAGSVHKRVPWAERTPAQGGAAGVRVCIGRRTRQLFGSKGVGAGPRGCCRASTLAAPRLGGVRRRRCALLPRSIAEHLPCQRSGHPAVHPCRITGIPPSSACVVRVCGDSWS